MSASQDEIPPPPPPSTSQTPTTQQTPHTVSTIKLPILKKGEYDIWAMKMEHYLAHTDYPIWEVIQNGNGPVSITTDTQGQIKVLPPRTAEEIVARERERKARTTLLMALPEDHLAKFHKMTDAKEMWDAIKSRFGGNDESKKMQKYILKQQFEGFSVSNSEGLHKGYDRFQSLLSQLEIHGAGVSTEDANQKFLRSLPSAWSQVSLIMRTKPGVDSLSFDDLYNNLRVFENDVKGSTASSSSTQNVAFVSENTSSTNDVSTAYSVSNPSGQNSQYEQTSSYSLLANQSSCPQLDHEDLEQLDEYDLEEMDLKWQVAMISMRMKKFYKKTGRKLQFDAKEPVGFDKTKVECYNCHKTGHFARECRTKGNQDSRRRDAWNFRNKDGRRSGKQEDSKALVTIDGEGVDWTSHLKKEDDYALMACNSSGENYALIAYSNSGSTPEVRFHHALIVSPLIYTSYIEQFWNTTSSQTVNDVKQINATVDSKAVIVTEASIRSSLLFNDTRSRWLGSALSRLLESASHIISHTEVIVGLTRCFEKMETVFISVIVHAKYQVVNMLRAHCPAKVYCPRNEIQKMETELWNLTVKGNDLTAYNSKDNIKGNGDSCEFTKDSRMPIRIANQLMDKKVQGYAARSAENKRRMESNLRDNRGQQPPFKRQNTSWTQTRIIGLLFAPNTQRAPVGNQQGIICYECGRPGHFRKDCPKLRNQNRGNQTRNKNGNKTGNQTRGNETTVRAYPLVEGGTNPIPQRCPRGFIRSNSSNPVVSLVVFGCHIGMDWLVEISRVNRLVDEKVVRIPYGNEVFENQGDNCDSGSLAGYYRRFIEGFSKIARPMTKLTQKSVKFEWGEKAEAAFQLLKQKLCSAPILALPEGSENFVKCMADEPLAIPLDEIQVDDKLNFIEEPVEIMDREVKRLKQSRIPIVKVRWNSRRGPEFTWEQDSVGTPVGRVILYGTIPTTIPDTTPVITPPATQTNTLVIPTETPIIAPTIPPSPDYTPASPDYSPASDLESDLSKDPSSDHIPPLPAISPFLSSDDDTTDSDTPDTPPLPTHGTPFIEITASTQRSPIIPRRRVMILSPGQPIPHGRPYRYHLNGPVHMMTVRKRVGALPTHHLAMRHSADHSSSDSSSEASSNFHSDASSYSSSRHSLSNHSSPNLPGTFARTSRKRRRSPTTSVPALSPVSGALSPVRADLIPSPKRVKDSSYLADVEVDPREISLRDYAIVRVSDEPHLEQDIDLEIQPEINECIAYADALKDRGIDARVVVEAVDRDETETGVRGPVEVRVEREGAVEVTYETLGDLVLRFHDHTQAILVHHIQTIEGVQREQEHRIVGVESAVIALTERVAELERDNRRLRGTVIAEEMEAREAARTLEPLNENGDEQEGENRGNGNGGNRGNGNGGNGGNGYGGNRENRNRGNGHRNGNHGMNYVGFMPVARECTFQDFLKCKPYNFSGTEGVVGLTRWFEKMETVFNISNCPSKYQVKYATCTLQDSSLTWWNSHKRTIGVDAAYAMNWAGLMRLMTEVYYPRNEIQKMETELWNLTVKGNDLTAYTQRFQELILLCTRMVPDEEDRVERFIGGLLDNIQGNVIAANPARLQDAIRIAN
ncbi:putative reverse transcriptase domain-containing protein [Tanacetum coccineum]